MSSGERTSGTVTGSGADPDARRLISRAVAAQLKGDVGKGPESVRSLIVDDLVLVLLEDALTRSELTLAADDRKDVVRNMRRAVHEPLGDVVAKVVEEATGRPVLTAFSDYSISPDHACEAFLLEGRPEALASAGASPAAEQIAREVAAIYERSIGSAPDRVRPYADEDVVAVLLEGTLTRAEESLALRERPAVVQRMRRDFQSMLESGMVDVVRTHTGREVRAFLSDHSIFPDFALEIFILERGAASAC